MIKIIILDVDGTLTDGKISYDSNGNELKSFDVKDGFAIVNWIRIGRKVAIITGRNSPIVEKRAKELGIKHCYQGVKNKFIKLQEVLQEESISLDETATIGDDLNDFVMLKNSKISFSPADASELISEAVDVKLKRGGGSSAVAEMIEYILKKENQIEAYAKYWKEQ